MRARWLQHAMTMLTARATFTPPIRSIPWRERLIALLGGAATALIGARRRPALAPAAPVGIEQRRTVLIRRSRPALYRILRDLEHLPAFLEHLDAVTETGRETSRWSVRDGDQRVEWTARITEDVPGERIAWESMPGGDLIAGGTITLSDCRRGGTIVDLEIWYRPAMTGPVKPAVRRLFERANGRRISANLLTLRELVDRGELDPKATPRPANSNLPAAPMAELEAPPSASPLI